MMIRLLTILATLTVIDEVVSVSVTDNTNNKTVQFDHGLHESKVLSRRKRFLVFPDGSSFQLVFCTQTHGYLQVGDIVWFGNTAALAWELPSDPQLFYMFKGEKHEFGNRRMDSKHIVYLDEDGKVVGNVPYRRKPIISPVFAKRSVDEKLLLKKEKTFTKKEMHNMERSKNHFKDLDKDRIEFHRKTRRTLYGKVEKVLEGLGWNGRECILRFLCETGKQKRDQGSFLEEILRTTFTLPRGWEFESKLHQEYDIAHRTGGDCVQQYPDCVNGLLRN